MPDTCPTCGSPDKPGVLPPNGHEGTTRYYCPDTWHANAVTSGTDDTTHCPTCEVAVVPASRLREAEADRDYAVKLASAAIAALPPGDRTKTLAAMRDRIEALKGERLRIRELDREALEKIANNDWTQPPSVMPDEMGREALKGER